MGSSSSSTGLKGQHGVYLQGKLQVMSTTQRKLAPSEIMTYQMCHKRVFDPNFAKETLCVSIVGQPILGRDSGQWGLHEVEAREPEPLSENITRGRKGVG